MDDKGIIVSTCDVDDNLALQIWTKGHTPRLVILNKVKKARKLIPLGWLEKADRKLSINGAKRGETISYAISDFFPVVKRILTEYVVKTNFRPKFAKLAVEFEKVVHIPELITEKKQLALLSEDKRSSLWIADCTGANKQIGAFRPFFPAQGTERDALAEEKLRILGAGRGVDALFATGVITALKEARPERWNNPIRVTAAAMLLNFSFCGGDGVKFADELWQEKKPTPASTTGTMKAPTRLSSFSLHAPGLMGLGHKLVAYIRHIDALEKVEAGTSQDSEKELHDLGYSRTRRLDVPADMIGDVPYRVTFYENEEEGRRAFGCVPQSMTLRHPGELVFTVPTDIYEAARKDDTMGNAEDDLYTLSQLIWGRQFKNWYESVMPYVKGFVGLAEAKPTA